MKYCRELIIALIFIIFSSNCANAADYSRIYSQITEMFESNECNDNFKNSVVDAVLLLVHTEVLTELDKIGETQFAYLLKDSADEAIDAITTGNKTLIVDKTNKFLKNFRTGLALCDRNIISFMDVDLNAWYHKAIVCSVSQGLFNGIDEFNFSPDAKITRGMFLTVVGRIHMKTGEKYVESYSDVSDEAYYSDSVKWAKANGILFFIEGDLFEPNKPITREEMVSILKGCALYSGQNISVGNEDSFSDYEEVSDWARESVLWASQQQIVSGFEDGSFRPKDIATRAQASQIFLNYIFE